MVEKNWDSTVETLHKASERHASQRPAPPPAPTPAMLSSPEFTKGLAGLIAKLFIEEQRSTDERLKLLTDRIVALEAICRHNETQFHDLMVRHLTLLAER